MQEQLDENNDIYDILVQKDSSYTNHCKIKVLFYNLSYFIKENYPLSKMKYIEEYVRRPFSQEPLKSNFS